MRYHNKKMFMIGVRLGVPIAIGYIPIAITFGLIIKSSEIPIGIGMLMSLIVFAGASQFIGANLIIMGAKPMEIVLTTFILNFRHFLMSSSLIQRIKPNITKRLLSIISFGVTDESFAVASLQDEPLIDPYKILGLNLVAYLSWNVGTWIGLFIGNTLPSQLQSSMGIALYAMFIGLLIPGFRRGKEVVIVASFAMVFNSMLYWIPIFNVISIGWRIIISTVGAAYLGTLVLSSKTREAITS